MLAGERSRSAAKLQAAGTALVTAVHVEVGRDVVEAVGVSGLDARVAEGEHRAAPEVEHALAVLVLGADAQGDEAGGRAVGAGAVLAQADDLGARAQGVADEDRAQEDEAAVEEVAAHALGRAGRLADRHVADEVRVDELLGAAGHGGREGRVERQEHPVADEGLVDGRVPGGERQARGVEDLADLEVLEVRTTHLDRLGAKHPVVS